jgi:hypothetical protein
MIAVNEPLFKLGQVVATPDAIAALQKTGEAALQFLSRHVQGDWGCLSDDDRQLNDEAVKDGSRILSAYILKDGTTKIWIITEAEDENGSRSSSTILLPENY